jgi:hypothetical protein
VVTKAAPSTAYLSNAGVAAFSYDIRVRNAGPDPAPHTTLTDRAPTGARFVRITRQPSQGSCSITGGGSQLHCSLGTLVANQSVDVQVDVAVRASGGNATNLAVASCTPEPSGPCTATTTATTRLLAPFTPPRRPALACPAVSVKGSLRASGRPQTITISAAHNGNPAAGTRLHLGGAGVSRIVRLGPGGTATVTLSPTRPGTLTLSVPGVRGCAATTITIAAVSPAQVTG